MIHEEPNHHAKAGILALLTVLVVIAALGAAVVRTTSPARSTGHVAPRAGAEPHAATGPMPREDGFSPFIDWIDQEYPTRVGNISHDGDKYTVGIVNLTDGDTAAIQQELTKLGLKADVVSVTISESETNQLMQAIESSVKGHHFASVGADASGLITLSLSDKASDSENAAITDSANRTVDGFVDSLNQDDPSRHLTRDAIFAITTGPDAVPMDWRADAPPRGGSWLSVHNTAPVDSYGCTEGYTTVNGSGRAYGITAGHCGADTDTGTISSVSRVWGSDLVGNTTANFYGQVPGGGNAWADFGSDVMRYPIDGYAVQACVLSGFANCRPVIGYHANATQLIGDYICGAGLGTQYNLGIGEHCGTLEYRHIVVDEGAASFYLNCFRQHPYKGDSGGPVYEPSNGNAVAYGISVALIVASNGHEEWCYGRIADYLAAMNLSLSLS